MRFLVTCAAALALPFSAVAQLTLTGTASPTSSGTPLGDGPSGDVTYNSNTSPSPLPTSYSYTSRSGSSTGTDSNTITASNATITSSNAGSTVLVGSSRSNTLNGTASLNGTATSSSTQPVNTQPCNGYTELCTRRYSNITHVAAHNSPFVQRNNVAANQALDVETQLNDGIRMLQFQVHKPNDTLYLCHSTCDLLNAGTLVSYLTTVNDWMQAHRYEVITILMGNSNRLDPNEYVQSVVDSGLIDKVYVPDSIPMGLDGWPTLEEMILTNKRVVFMLDYDANQEEVPWLLDEFSYMWETPFSPTDRDFPCTVQRPPDQAREVSENRMSMANHNLNIEISALGLSILVPAFPLLNETNAETGYGSAGAAVDNCTAEWNRPPTFLLVDYYNIGSPINGSVMAVAAAANNVTYNQDSCCGVVNYGAATSLRVVGMWSFFIPAILATLFAI